MTLPSDFSSSNLNVGNSLPESSGSGTLFMKLGSPASARLVPTRVAAVAARGPRPLSEVSALEVGHGVLL